METLNQIKSFLLVYGAVKTTINDQGGVVGIWEGSLGCEFLRGSICAEGMVCGRRLVRFIYLLSDGRNGHEDQ